MNRREKHRRAARGVRMYWCTSLAAVMMLVVGPLSAQENNLTHIVEQAPMAIRTVRPGVFLVDFGRVAFGNLALIGSAPILAQGGKITVRFGEALKDGRVDTHPPGSVRFAEVRVTLSEGATMIVAPPADARNTKPPAVLTSKSWGVLLPFRWVEIEGWPAELRPEQIRRRAVFDSTWQDEAASFHSSDAMLDRVWELCHYSIKATTFAGVFVDGDRERLAYEADAYIDQLGYYAGDADARMPRATFDRLMEYPTWPTEWAPQMVFMAYADWMETGDAEWLRSHYEGLKSKLLSDRVGPDGLVLSSAQQMEHGDIVDWPLQERDGYVFTSVNTVVNAFHLSALKDMARLAEALGKKEEAERYADQERMARASFQGKLFDQSRGLYRDGAGTEHTSLHANLFPLTFGLVPQGRRQHVAEWLAGRGMAGSVYAAQYLLEGLFESGEDAAALRLMTAPGDRSWRHMVDAGATITWEAWDQRYKPNQDWNHAWGAAPANLLPRFVLGAQPLSAGWGQAMIQPHPGDLLFAEGKIPTPRGSLVVSWTRGKSFVIRVEIPSGMTARIKLPVVQDAREIRIGGRRVGAQRQGAWWTVESDVSGSVEIEER